MNDAMLQVSGLTKSYPQRRGRVTVLQCLDFELQAGRSLAIVGESGSGKTTAAMAIAKLVLPDAGKVQIGAEDFLAAGRSATTRLRRNFGVVLQNPLTSLDPRIPIWRSVAEPLEVHEPAMKAPAIRKSALAMLARVGLDTLMADRCPHQLSGGQLQRAVIARALILQPRFVILDEPTSALDVSVQAQVLNLLCDLRDEFNLSYLFITHNLALVEIIAHDVLVMYAGAVVERGPVHEVFSKPRHPYTADLLAAVPTHLTPPQAAVEKSLEDAAGPGGGCAYHQRCRHAQPRCAVEVPAQAREPSSVSCFFPL